MGYLAQSAFVDEDNDPALFSGFFLVSGQRYFFHCRIACSCRDILSSREGRASPRTMKAKYRPVNRLARPIVCICLLFVLLAWPAKSIAHDEWFRGLDLEPALSEASLVLAGRVVDVSRTGITVGGKGERTLLQFKFVPVLTLKGVFSRESLSLTSDDIGIQFSDAASLDPGELRLLILGRSSQGYAIQRQPSSLEQTVPLLRDSNDGLLETVKVLLAVNASRERPRKVVVLLEGLRKQRGPSVIPLAWGIRASLAACSTDIGRNGGHRTPLERSFARRA